MINETFKDIEKLESDLWEAADNLRANSKLTSSDYFMPVLGVIFLRHAADRFDAAHRQIEADRTSGKMPKRKVLPVDYIARRAVCRDLDRERDGSDRAGVHSLAVGRGRRVHPDAHRGRGHTWHLGDGALRPHRAHARRHPDRAGHRAGPGARGNAFTPVLPRVRIAEPSIWR